MPVPAVVSHPLVALTRTAVGGAALAAAALLLAGCATTAGRAAPGHVHHRAASRARPTASKPRTPRRPAPGRAAGAAVWWRLVQYPGPASQRYGFAGIIDQIDAARTSVSMEMYELTDTDVEAALARAAHRGVTVRVLLDKDFTGGRVNAASYTYLARHGVRVRWAPAGYIFHIKAITFDHATSDISTANLTSQYYATTRDAMVVDTDPAQVKAIESTFDADFAAAPGGRPADQTSQGRGLVWSPYTGEESAQDAVVAQIAAAKRSVAFTSEELSDPDVINALAAAARRGVACKVVMTYSTEWTDGFTTVSRAGCTVRTFPDSAGALYIHEKIVLDDAGTHHATLLIGSQNASTYSLTRNRELSLALRSSEGHGASTVIRAVAARFDTDYHDAVSYRPAPTGRLPDRQGRSTRHG